MLAWGTSSTSARREAGRLDELDRVGCATHYVEVYGNSSCKPSCESWGRTEEDSHLVALEIDSRGDNPRNAHEPGAEPRLPYPAAGHTTLLLQSTGEHNRSTNNTQPNAYYFETCSARSRRFRHDSLKFDQ
jgi:hypothetical protein